MPDNTDYQRGRRKIKSLKHRLCYLENKPRQTTWAKAEIAALKEAIELMEERYPNVTN